MNGPVVATFPVDLRQQADYQFQVVFGQSGIPPILTDEPPPLGNDIGPNPARLLGAAVGNCMASSLLFCLRKFKNDAEPIRASCKVELVRNVHKRLRVGHIAVELRLAVPAAALHSAQRVLEQFEDFCVVTQSLRECIPVDVRVLDRDGLVLQALHEQDAQSTAPP